MADTKPFKLFRVNTLPASDYMVGGIYFVQSENRIYLRTEDGWEAYGATDVVDKLQQAFQAITIYTDNTTEHMAANAAAIKAYEDNLKALGVDVTKGYSVAVVTDTTWYGVLSCLYFTGYSTLQGEMAFTRGENRIRFVHISSAGSFNVLCSLMNDNSLATESDDIVNAINEVHALFNYKQDKTDDTLSTSDKTVVGAINEVYNNIVRNNTRVMTVEDQLDMKAPKTVATQSSNGLMSADDKKKLDGITGSGTAPIVFDFDTFSTAGNTISDEVWAQLLTCVTTDTPAYMCFETLSTNSTRYIFPISIKGVWTTTTSGEETLRTVQIRGVTPEGKLFGCIATNKNVTMPSEYSLLPSSTLSAPGGSNAARLVQSSTIWSEIHSEKIYVDTTTAGASKELTTAGEHKILVTTNSGTHNFILPSAPQDGETFTFIKARAGAAVTITPGTKGSLWVCASGTSSTTAAYTIPTAQVGKITVTWVNSETKWYIIMS